MDKYFVDQDKHDDRLSPPDWSKLHDPEADISKTKIKKDESVNIDINLILGGGKPPHGMMGKPKNDFDDGCNDKFGMPKHGFANEGFSKWPSGKDEDDQDSDELDWKSIAKQLLQSISMMDSHSDGYENGSESAEGALAAIDNETSRVLWGKQSNDNPMSSYQNANYGATTSNGMVMTNPAVTDNVAAYGKADPDNDGDVDFDSSGRFIDTGKDEPHGNMSENDSDKSDGPDWEALYKMLCEECGIDPEDGLEDKGPTDKPKEKSPSIRPMIEKKDDKDQAEKPKEESMKSRLDGNVPKPMPKQTPKPESDKPNAVSEQDGGKDIDENYDKKGFPKAQRR